MDDLVRFIIGRVRQRIHPYIPKDDGWRRYPPHIAGVLKRLEPLHIVTVAPSWVGVDGVYIDDPRGMHTKYEESLETLEAIFGDAACGSCKKICEGNMELRSFSNGISALSYFRGSLWFIAICVDVNPYPERFAFVAEAHLPCMRSRYTCDDKRVKCVAVRCGDAPTSGEAKVGFSTSIDFFIDPRPENAKLLGDLLFLAQMGNGWSVNREVECEVESSYFDPYSHIANVLKRCPGCEDFIRHARMELLIRDEEDRGWKGLLRAIEAADRAKEVLNEGQYEQH